MMPDFSLEDSIAGTVCGLDEVGRGPLAGPVVAACVHIPDRVREMSFMALVQDSKKLSKKRLEELSALIREHCAFAICESSPSEIDQINILQASLKSMRQAYAEMQLRADHALVDGRQTPSHMPCAVTPVIKGDSKSKSIAAASILAKHHRDEIMKRLAEEFPHYGWERNAGYPTREHVAAINKHGVTRHHRKSFRPVAEFLACGETSCQTRFAV